MKPLYALFILIMIVGCQTAQETSELQIDGLYASVEVIRDSIGINHIYAQNQHDLFLAQGYLAAKDRLFQFEIWRRQATGTVAEILGSRELERDIGTRLFKFRGDMQKEMQHYHPEGEEIITAYVAGVNAYISEALQQPESLPITFKALGILPEPWTPEVVVSRHQGLLGNIETELMVGMTVAAVGEEKVREYAWFHPNEPVLKMAPGVNPALLTEDILSLYKAFRQDIKFMPSDLLPEYRQQEVAFNHHQNTTEDMSLTEQLSIGSNNWVVSGELMADGHTLMANDPHRKLAIPSLRYMVHLHAPGWNVIGGGEPEIPGVSIGHNEHGAWGLTVFRIDGEDLYVYDLNPDDLHQYRFQGGWENLEILQEEINVKGSDPEIVTLRYTRHGPVTFIDTTNLKAYAVKCAWLAPGGAPYLASLRMDQAKNWEEFRDACSYSHIPGENMIWADKEGNIGWQAVGIAPVRKHFSGLVPIPGDGSHEWDGYLPIKQLPHDYNPPSGFIATANQHVTPDAYAHTDAISYLWADPYRGNRVNEVLSSGKKFTREDMTKLQTDYLSIPARTFVPLLTNISTPNEVVSEAIEILSDWDYTLSAGSVAATIYVMWEKEMHENFFRYYTDEPDSIYLGRLLQLSRIAEWVTAPEKKFGADALNKRNQFLQASLTTALQKLTKQLGEDKQQWAYGQTAMKHAQITHPLGEAVSKELQGTLNTTAMPRGGNAYTPGSTSTSLRQSSGASFRMIVPTGDWDAAVATNTPGQSGNPDSRFYTNLFESWSRDEFFSVFFTKEKVEAVAAEKYVLRP